MTKVHIAMIRGCCQIPAYLIAEEQRLAGLDIEVTWKVEPAAWMIPPQLSSGTATFGIIPWTRAVLAQARGERLVVVCGSGIEEAAIVVRRGLSVEQVKRLAVPQPGGLKDLLAAELMKGAGWTDVQAVRNPSGDAAMISFIGAGADAVSLVEPFATMMQDQGIGYIARDASDVFPGAPGCSLVTSRSQIDSAPDIVSTMVAAFVAACNDIRDAPSEAAKLSEKYIGISSATIERALSRHLPNPYAVDNSDAIHMMLEVMKREGHDISRASEAFELSFLHNTSKR